ncbi:MAG: nucleotidyltransferase domain-containing protein [Pseudomonadota bacterium]|nr:nucleotidyltransferase domain-containing protein [Pseudomonadota bacterium]
MIDLQPGHLSEVRSILRRYLPGTQTWAFGSRVDGTALEASDLDLVAHLEDTELSLAPAKTAFRDSNLPFSVDLFNWSSLPKHFQQEILKNYEVIQGN